MNSFEMLIVLFCLSGHAERVGGEAGPLYEPDTLSSAHNDAS